MINSLRYAHCSSVVAPKETPVHEGVGVTVGVFVGVGIVSAEDTEHT